jgi:SAM-dependent methyltransferase
MLNTQSFWDELYNNEEVGWDMKSPTPVIKSYLKEQKFPISSKILIMGSGYGYDAIEAAKAGLDVTAVDFSAAAIKIAKKSANEQNVTVKFLVQDFFTFTEKFQNYFHLVYDYVTYCVIYPVRRKEYGKMIYDVLSCNGLFIALWFPVEKR